MGSRFEVEVTVTSARDLKNVNWRHGELKPYAVLWVEDGPKCSTKVAVEGDVNPIFEEKVSLPVPLPPGRRLEECTLYVDLVHARSGGEEDTKPLIGSARLPLGDVLEEVGIGGGKLERTLKLKRPSGRPHGKIDLRVAIKDPQRYYAAAPSPYGQPVGSRDYYAPPPPAAAYGGYGQSAYGGGYGQQPPYGAAAAPPVGYPYGAPPVPVAYGGGAPPPAQMYGGGAPPAQMYGQSSGGGGGYVVEEQKKKKSGMGVGTGLAVGAVAGVLGGLALAEGVDYVEDKIEDNVAERVEDDLAYEDGGYDDF